MERSNHEHSYNLTTIHMQRPWHRLWSAACSVLCVSTIQLYQLQQGVQWGSWVGEQVVITYLTVSLRQEKRPLNTKNAAFCNEWGRKRRESKRGGTLLNQIHIISLPLTDLLKWFQIYCFTTDITMYHIKLLHECFSRLVCFTFHHIHENIVMNSIFLTICSSCLCVLDIQLDKTSNVKPSEVSLSNKQ